MKNKAQVVVIGGGVVGAGTLYHLAKKGWTDVVLLERKDLTSGSTWHAAGLLPLFNMSYSVGKLHQYSVNFYSLFFKTSLIKFTIIGDAPKFKLNSFHHSFTPFFEKW